MSTRRSWAVIGLSLLCAAAGLAAAISYAGAFGD